MTDPVETVETPVDDAPANTATEPTTVETAVESTPATPSVKKVPPVKKAPVPVKSAKKAPGKKAPAAASKKAPAKKAVKKAAVKKAAKPAVKKEPKEPRVKKADTWLPKILKYLAKYPDGKTLADIKTHFSTTDFGGIFGGNLFPDLIQKSRVEGVKGIVMVLTAKGRKQSAL